MRNLYLFVGPSGSGKTTIIKELNAKYGWPIIESYTDRPPRYPNEVGHRFISESEFNNLPVKLAYGEYAGHRYCIAPELIKNGGLYAIEPSGIPDVKRYVNEHFAGRVQMIGIQCSEMERAKRMLGRGDSFQKVTERIENDKSVFQDIMEDCNLVITEDMNQSGEQAMNCILDTVASFIMEHECGKPA